jgi:hypothetical protein
LPGLLKSQIEKRLVGLHDFEPLQEQQTKKWNPIVKKIEMKGE